MTEIVGDLVCQVEHVGGRVGGGCERVGVCGAQDRHLPLGCAAAREVAHEIELARRLARPVGVLAIGAEDATVDDGDALRAVQQLRGALLDRIGAAVEQLGEDRRDHPVEEDRRQRDLAAADERKVVRLDRPGSQERIAKAEEGLIVVARIVVEDCREVGAGDGGGRLSDQAPVQRSLAGARLFDQRELGKRQQAAQELVSGRQPALAWDAALAARRAPARLVHPTIIGAARAGRPPS